MPDGAMTYVGKGVYTLKEASNLLRVPSDKIRRWAFGTKRTSPILHPDYEKLEGAFALSFLDLIEARLVIAFRSKGVPLQHLRKVAEKAAERWNSHRPFANTRFKTDGRRIFEDFAGADGEARLVDFLANQHVFHRIVEQSLLEGVEFDAAGLAAKWRPRLETPHVVLDPKRSFGRPIVDHAGIPTSVLTRALKAEGGIEKAARAYGVRPDDVKEAVIFEELLAA